MLDLVILGDVLHLTQIWLADRSFDESGRTAIQCRQCHTYTAGRNHVVRSAVAEDPAFAARGRPSRAGQHIRQPRASSQPAPGCAAALQTRGNNPIPMQHIHTSNVCLLTWTWQKTGGLLIKYEQTRPNTQLLACGAAISVLRTSTVSVHAKRQVDIGVTLWHLSTHKYVHAETQLAAAQCSTEACASSCRWRPTALCSQHLTPWRP
jgi:hypothetical protein